MRFRRWPSCRRLTTTPPAAWMRDVSPDVRSNADFDGRRLLVLSLDDEPASSHEADALAVAICHALAPPRFAEVVG